MDSIKTTINYGNYALNDIQHEMRKSFAYGLFSFLNTIKFCIQHSIPTSLKDLKVGILESNF